MIAIIDPRTRVVYASYYIEGLWKVLGKKQVTFSMQPFKELKQSSVFDDFDQYFAMVIIAENGFSKRIIIDYRDKSNLNTTALKWCDLYGKVNFNSKDYDFENLDENGKLKILPIGTNFGIRLWSYPETIYLLFANFLKSLHYLPVSFRTFLSGYNWQIKRKSLSYYQSSKSSQNYVFHASTFYLNQNHGDIVNSLRAEFIRTCKNNTNCLFEGGLFTKSQITNQSINQYKDVLTDKYILPEQYIANIKKSAFVFNSPAAWACHGWKLGEYLAMGKAIISTPFINEMPEAMIHGENILFVETESEMRDAVNLLLSDDTLRRKLQNGAEKYYEKWLKPEIIIGKLIQ